MSQIQTEQFTYDTAAGLSDAQAAAMRQKYGKNELTPPKRTSWWWELLKKFEDPTIRILLAAAVISLVIAAIERYGLRNHEASFIDSTGIFIAVLLATFVGFFSERKSAHEFELLNKVKNDITVKTLRNGQIGETPIGELTVGDLVRIELGDKIPADGVLIDTMGLYIDQAMLTGESIPVHKTSCAVPEQLEAFLKTIRPDDGFFAARGTMAVDGYGLLLVTAVGDQTQMGQIARSLGAGNDDKEETPLALKLSRLANQISVVGVMAATGIFTIMTVLAAWKSPLLKDLFHLHWEPVCIGLFSIGIGLFLTRFALKPFFAGRGILFRSFLPNLLAALPMTIGAFTVLLGVVGFLFLDGEAEQGILLLKNVLLAFVVAVTIIVVAVPEGLPMMVTVSLALNMMKMTRENCLVRTLIASETIGSATVICTDKTGTLTQNKMTPVRIFAGGRFYDSSTFVDLTRSPEWDPLTVGIAVNSQANLHIEKNDADGTETVTGIGNPTECALLQFLHAHQIEYRNLRTEYRRFFELAHNSERKMSVTAAERDHQKICLIKGAPERIISACNTILADGEERPIEEYRGVLEEELARASEDALRVLAFSQCRIDSNSRHEGCGEDDNACLHCGGRCFVGFIGIADPIRSEVPQAVKTCSDAHIRVKMITGDALPTATAIARQAGIYQDRPEELVMSHDEFAVVTEEALSEVAEKICVLARSTPMDKLRLVKALHKRGEVVAMTGDGTNDAPALKYADVGLSMGITGTEVAKEASDIVLLDDNFKSIVTGVWWGRTLFQNIQRFLQFQLSVNAVALFCALIGPLVGVPLPLTVTQLLWINIIMDTFAALALSTDPPRPRTMREKPTSRNAHIITGTMGVSILVVSLYQTAILFSSLFFGWFVNAEHRYDFSIAATDPEYLHHNLQALTIFFTVLVMFQFWHKFNCRALRHDESPFSLLHKNRLFLSIVFVITIVQVVMVQTPVIGEIFRTEPLSWWQWLDITLLTATVIPVAWLGRKLPFWLKLD